MPKNMDLSVLKILLNLFLSKIWYFPCLFQDIAEEGENDEYEDDEMADIEALNYDDLDTVAKLQKSQRFHDIMVVSIPLFLLVFTQYFSVHCHRFRNPW